jgi:hypothetical protein
MLWLFRVFLKGEKVKKILLSGFLALFVLIGSVPAFAVDLDQLQRQIDLMADEIESFKFGKGSAGSKHDRVKVHGYGELHYNNKVDENGGDTEIDQHRFVIGVHAILADWIHLNAEIDFEHAAQELEFELAYLDFLIDEAFNARAGVMILPVGYFNEFHEPNLFWSVERPQFQNKIIPTTWSGAGAGIFGTPVEGVNYRLYVVNAVKSVREAGFSTGGGSGGSGGTGGRFRASSGIRSGRQQINELVAEDFALTGRVELTRLFPGLQLGASFYTGNTTHNIIDEDGFMFLIEGDMKYRLNWFEMNASIANITIEDAAEINAFCASANPLSSCDGNVGDNIFGWNVQAGVHVPQLLGMNTSHDVVVWFMYEKIRPQDSLPTSIAATTSQVQNGVNFNVYQAGVTYLPIPNVAIKADWQHKRFDNPNFGVGNVGKAEDTVNLGIAYMY